MARGKVDRREALQMPMFQLQTLHDGDALPLGGIKAQNQYKALDPAQLRLIACPADTQIAAILDGPGNGDVPRHQIPAVQARTAAR